MVFIYTSLRRVLVFQQTHLHIARLAQFDTFGATLAALAVDDDRTRGTRQSGWMGVVRVGGVLVLRYLPRAQGRRS